MKQFIICAALVFALSSVRAEDTDSPVKHMKPPKGITLTPEQEKMLAEANQALESAYKLLLENHDPQKAVDELRRAHVIANQLKMLKEKAQLAGVMPGNEKGTPEDKIETEGGIERIIEIAAAIGVGAPPEVNNGLYQRKIVKKATEEAKKLETEQRALTEQITSMGNGNGKPDHKPPQPAAPSPDQQNQPNAEAQKNQAQANANPNQQNQPNANAQQNQAQANADPKQQNQPNANGQQDKAQANADPKQQNQPNANGQQNQAQANADPKQQNQPNANGQQNKAQANADPKQQNQPNAGGQQGGADELARRQEAVAMTLNKIATEMTPTGNADPAASKAAQAFRKAADAASQTAQMLRNNQTDAAAAASRQVERAIGEAQAAAGAAGNQNQAETLAAIQKQIDGVQNSQQKILGQTQQIHKNADGSTASEAVQKDRAAALAIEEGKLKPQVENIQNALKALAENTDAGPPNSAQNAAREETTNALNAMQQGRSRQGVVNATMKLANGEPASAATAMAQIQNALNAARQHVAAANTALAGNNARLEQEYRQIQQAAAALRRLEQNAKNAAGGNESGTPDGQQNKNNKGEPNKEIAAKPPTDPANQTKDPNAQNGQESSGTISATWGAVLNHTADQINADLQKLAPNLAAANAEAAKQISDLAGKKTSFERDRDGSLGQVRALLGAVEKVELELAKKVAGDDEKKALRNYRKDEIPLPYRKAVASYYEELSKDQQK